MRATVGCESVFQITGTIFVLLQLIQTAQTNKEFMMKLGKVGLLGLQKCAPYVMRREITYHLIALAVQCE